MSVATIFRGSRPWAIFVRSAVSAQKRRRLATKPSPPFPVVPSCPSPTCSCAATPEFPDELQIDRTAPLNGFISQYAQHVLVCTGKDDWPSRIEEDNSGDNLAADLKELLGRGGKYNDPFYNISVLNSSFPSLSPLPTPTSQQPQLQTTSVYLLPRFTYVPFLPRVSFDSVEALVRGYLQPETLHRAHDGLSPIHRDRLRREPAYRSLLLAVRDVHDVMVLVCGHGGRDMRCGVMGPVLRQEFEARLPEFGVTVLKGPAAVGSGVGGDGPLPELGEEAASAPAQTAAATARVGLISHIGGHKFAGNVIIYLPPHMRATDGSKHPLAGHGIWYGRVEPRHVQGVLEETVVKGNVISELFRGAINNAGDIIRL